MQASRFVFAALALLHASFLPKPVRAADSAAIEGITVPPGGGQAALATRVIGTTIAYRTCAQIPCVPAAGDPSIALPLGASAQDVVIDALPIGSARHVLFAHTPTFGALIAAVPGAAQARVLWSGAMGFSKGEEGERFGESVQVTDPESDKTVRLLFGEVREDVTICGRPTLLSPKVLDPKDLAFKAVRLQRLRRDERDRAPVLAAEPSAAPPLQGLGRILQGAAASSGIGTPAALTDGDPETTWSEKRGGEGNGEFVQLNVPEQVAIDSLSIVARPPTRIVPKGAGPRKLWLATPEALFAVTFAEDPWTRPGASYLVKFAAPIKTRCLAIVLDEAYVKGKDPDVDVTLAEISAHTEFDANMEPAALAGALAGGQERARMAAAILSRSGEPGYEAIAQAYPTLDDAGRVLALEIIDTAPCMRSAPVYLKAMEVGRPGEVHHAIDRLTRCGRDAATALSGAVTAGSDSQKMRAANLLALVAPDVAVTTLVALLPAAKQEVRAEFRAALTKASQHPRARDLVSSKLADPVLPPIAAIDLLRAVTASRASTPSATTAFARLATAEADFRTRYLLLGPAAALAGEGDARAESFLLHALTSDADNHVRARAAEVAASLPKALAPLEQALADTDPRVRDASVNSIAHLVDPKGAKVQLQAWPAGLLPAILELLASDPFTFVRAHAADALVFAPAGNDVDRPLAKALEDASAVVRARVVDSLGRRGSTAHGDEIRERLDDDAEQLDVRVRAARALGRVCHMKSVDRLTELARRVATPGATGDALMIGASAATALARINPPDLSKRLAPLADKSAPRVAQEIAKAAVASSERCR